MSFLTRKTPLVAAVALATASSLSHAQLMLEEVIVTAQKRAESLQDVPISVTAIQGEKLQSAGIQNMAQLADHVPNLHIADAPVNTNIYMRGMGSGNNQAFEQSVGMYIDGVYMGRGRQYRSPFMDIERVEVLRGPQGTLFGKNTVAGAVNITTASPGLDDPFNGSIAVNAETNDGYIVEGFLSGAVSENFALRAAFKYRENAGFIENTYLDQDEPEIEDKTFRLTAVWQITDNLDATFKYSKSKYEREGVNSSGWLYLSKEERERDVPNKGAFQSAIYAVTDSFFPAYAGEAGKEFETYKDNGQGSTGAAWSGKNPESSDNEADNFVMTLNYYMGEHTLTAVTGYSEYEFVDGADVDWLPARFINRDDDQTFEQISQEIRLASPIGGKLDYMVGAYYEESELVSDRRVAIDGTIDGLFQHVQANVLVPGLPDFLTMGDIGLPTVGSAAGAAAGLAYSGGELTRDHLYELDSDSWALFAQGTYNFNDNVRLTLGVRYTEETKDVHSTQILTDDIVGIGIENTDPVLGQIFATNFNTYAYDFTEDRETEQWIPSANLQWNVGEDTLLYFSWSGGFKSGGFTAADDLAPGDLEPSEWGPYDPTNPPDDFEFDDEEVSAFEIGGKHTLLDGAMTLNWAAFYTDYTDLQIAIFKGVGFTVTNADAEVQGLEVDALWQATEGLRLGANFAYLDSVWKDYAHGPCTALQLDIDAACGLEGALTNNDLSDETSSFAPEYSGSLYFDYSYLMGSGLELFAGGEVNYSDEFSPQGDKDPLDTTESFTKVNLRIGLRGASENWEVMLYGRNITDEQVYSISFDTPLLVGSHSAQIDEGEVYGARFKYMF